MKPNRLNNLVENELETLLKHMTIEILDHQRAVELRYTINYYHDRITQTLIKNYDTEEYGSGIFFDDDDD